MKIELDRQEREFIKSHARSMAILFRSELRGTGTRNATGADAMSLAFFERLARKMDEDEDIGIKLGRKFIGDTQCQT